MLRLRTAARPGRLSVVAALTIILAAALALRLVGSNWDDGAHLHPDERYMSTVADAIEWPDGIRQYFDVDSSPLSPYNSEKGRDYIYGTLPLFATKLAATVSGREQYGDLNIVGRRLAAVVDTLTTALVFVVALLLLGRAGPWLAAAGGLAAATFYAFTVTAIQHAHFFTADTWLVFWGMLTFAFALWALKRAPTGHGSDLWLLVFLGAALGLTVASKISGGLVALPVALALCGRGVIRARSMGSGAGLFRLGAETGTVIVSAYVAFRALSPYSFAQTNWLDVSINGSFRAALEQQARAVTGESLPPPSYQWLLSTPVWSPLENLTLWQLGLPLGLAAGAGLAVLGVAVAREARATTRGARDPDTVVAAVAPLMLLAFVGVVFAYFGTRFVHSGRYLLPLVPLLAVAAAAGLAALATRRPRAAAALALGIAAASALYATAFVGIYTRPNTRVAATEWIHANVPGGSAVANEHWDDPLPIGAIWLEPNDRPEPRTYRGVEVPVFDADDETKLRKLYDALAAADFYVVSSPRAWKTVGRLPDRFPLTTRYYEELLSGRLGFARAAEFSSPPRLLGLTLDDQRAEEAFWVYDHPPVLILRRSGQLDWKTFAARLCPRPAKPHCGPAAIG